MSTAQKIICEDNSPTINANDDDDDDDEGVCDSAEWSVKKIARLWRTELKFQSPIELDVVKTTRVILPCLNFNEYDKMPKKMKITNSGNTLILSAKWNSTRPYISGSILNGKYTLSQIHFHWGKSPFEGSEHSADGIFFPLEMHVVHFKCTYKTQPEALKYSDGVVTLVYLFVLKSQHSPIMYPILSQIPNIRTSDTAAALDPFVLSELVFPFISDYYLYWGKVTAEEVDAQMLWLITRDTCFISFEQLQQFHLLLDPKSRPIYKNSRAQSSSLEQRIFHVNPKYRFTPSTISPVPLRLDPENLECRDDIVDTPLQ